MSPESARARSRAAPAVLLLPVLAALVLAVVDLADAGRGLATRVSGALGDSGVDNPVTAVLLNFRSYDTLLEVAVLVVAAVTVWRFEPLSASACRSVDPVLRALVRRLLPVLVLTAGYLLWAGGKAPGGAFQAGALLGAGAVVMMLAGARVPPGWAGTLGRLALTGGLALFLVAGALPLAGGGQLLEYPGGQAGAWILLIEAASALSIGAILGLLFMGGGPRRP